MGWFLETILSSIEVDKSLVEGVSLSSQVKSSVKSLIFAFFLFYNALKIVGKWEKACGLIIDLYLMH